MIQSSNIRVMSSALLKIAKILRRDFSELEKIQNSKQNVEKFVFKSNIIIMCKSSSFDNINVITVNV